jgi:hypothetical protein
LHDPVNQQVMSQHIFLTGDVIRIYPVKLRYAWPSELDLMARLAGLVLKHRWGIGTVALLRLTAVAISRCMVTLNEVVCFVTMLTQHINIIYNESDWSEIAPTSCARSRILVTAVGSEPITKKELKHGNRSNRILERPAGDTGRAG